MRVVSSQNYFLSRVNWKNSVKSQLILKWLLLATMSITAWTGYKAMLSYRSSAEAVLVLGGHETREKFAADLAKENPNLEVWISSGSPQSYVKKIFNHRGVPSDRLHLDYQAQDTVTNFTTIVEELKIRDIDSVYLITSHNHMTRARIIGEIVLGSNGIIIKPLMVPSQSPSEPFSKSLRDSVRAVFWLLTGETGSELDQVIKINKH